MRRAALLGFVMLGASAASSAEPVANAAAPLRPLVVELELSLDDHAEKALFAVSDELGLRIKLDRVREPFRCTTAYDDDERGQMIKVSCDPTQRDGSTIANFWGAAPPDLLNVGPRRCSEEQCVRLPLAVRRHLELRLPIRGDEPDAPCPDGSKSTPVPFRFETRWRVDYDVNGDLARLPFLFLTASSPAVAIPVSWRDLRSSKCRAKSSQNELQVTCGEQHFIARQIGTRINFGEAAGALVLPCGREARWPTLP